MKTSQTYDEQLNEQFSSLKINIVRHDASPTGLPTFIEAHLGKSPKIKRCLALILGNYIYRTLGLKFQMTPEYRGRGKKTTLRWFMTWEDTHPILPNIYTAVGSKVIPMDRYLPLEFQSLILQDVSRGVFPRTEA